MHWREVFDSWAPPPALQKVLDGYLRQMVALNDNKDPKDLCYDHEVLKKVLASRE